MCMRTFPELWGSFQMPSRYSAHTKKSRKMVSRHRVFASSSFGKTDILILIIASHPRTLVKSRSSRHFVILVCHASFQSRHSTRQASFPHRLFVIISVPIPPQLLRHSSVTVPSRFSSAFFPEFTHGSSTSRAPMTRIIIFGSTPPVNPIVIHPKASVMACKKKKEMQLRSHNYQSIPSHNRLYWHYSSFLR